MWFYFAFFCYLEIVTLFFSYISWSLLSFFKERLCSDLSPIWKSCYSKCNNQETVECLATNGTPVSTPSPRLRDHHGKGDRKVVKSHRWGKNKVKQYHHSLELLTTVATWTRPTQNPSNHQSSMGVEELREFFLQLRSFGRSAPSGIRRVVSFKAVSLGRWTMLQWVAVYPEVSGQHKLELMGH